MDKLSTPLSLPELSSTPSNPTSGYIKVYGKSDNKFYALNSSGVEVDLTLGADGNGIYTGSGTISGTTNAQLASTARLYLSYSSAQPGVIVDDNATTPAVMLSSKNAENGISVFDTGIEMYSNDGLVGGQLEYKYGVLSFKNVDFSAVVNIQMSASSGTYTLTLPVNDGSSGQALTTDGSGVLSWTTIGGGSGTNLGYTASTRVLTSDTGTDVTLPLVTTGDAGLAPASGGGTTNFLRADATWAAIPAPTGAALTKTDDTNVTLSLGGTPSTALLNAASITLGWTGQLAVSRGGTGAGTLTGILVGNGTSAVSAVTGTANQLLRRNAGNTAYEFFTPTYLTGNQTITLSGDITGSGATSISTTIANDAVTYAKLQNVAANTFLANITGLAANVQEIATTRIPLFSGAITGTPSSSTYLRGDGAWVVAPVDGNGIYTGSGTITTDTTVSIAATKSFIIEHTNLAVPAFIIDETGYLALYSPNATHNLTVSNSGVSISPDLVRHYRFGTTGFEMSNSTDTYSVFLLASNSMSADYTLTLPVDDGTTGQVLSTNGSGVLSWITPGGGGLADGDYGDISVSGTGTVLSIDAGVVSNTELASATGGIYKGSGTIASGVVSTLTNSFALRYASGGVDGFQMIDSLDSVIIQSKDASQYFYANNTSSLVGSGTTYMEYIDGVLRLWDSDITHYVGIQPPATGSLTTSYTLTLPTTDGNSGEVLTTNGSGVLSWAASGGGSSVGPDAPGSEVVNTSNYTAVIGEISQADSTSAARTVTAPSSPAINDRFAVVDARATSATNNITINFTTTSQKLYGTIQDYTLNVNGGYVEFVYMGSSTGWVATKG